MRKPIGQVVRIDKFLSSYRGVPLKRHAGRSGYWNHWEAHIGDITLWSANSKALMLLIDDNLDHPAKDK